MSTSGRPLRIAFIGARGIGASYSGIETYYEEVGSRLVSYGHEVVAYCRPYFTPRNADFRGLTPVFIRCVRSKHGETFSHTLFSTLHVMRHPVDIVQFHALGPALFSGLPRLRGMRTITSICGLDWQREKWGRVARRFLQFCELVSYRLPDATSVVSHVLQQRYRERYGVEVTYIPNGVNLETVPPPKEIYALGLKGGDYFLFMGRISPEKGCEVMLDAFRSLGPGPMKLVVAGGSSYTDDYMRTLQERAPQGVIFPGRVGGRLRAELYGHAAAFLLPSTIEGLSVALLEAMSFGRCVLASDIPENLELVKGVGWSFPARDAGSLAQLMRRVIASPDEAAAMGRLARHLVETEYTWDQVARGTEAFYYQVLERRRCAAEACRPTEPETARHPVAR
jgi:glycosyltransferase involved in cell wall biosynthesis